MSLTQQQAVDEILNRFNTVWSTTGWKVAWPDVPLDPVLQKMIAGDDGVELEPWARITVRTNLRNQRTFGSFGNRIYTTQGVLFVEIFTPTGSGMTESYALAELVRDAFEQPAENRLGVWHRECRISENGSEGLWSRLTVTAEWECEQLK